MATMITSECINCGACEPECPNTAIYQGGVEWEHNGARHAPIANDIFYIVPEKCTECVGFFDHEACAAVCPVDCCVPNPDIPESEEQLIARAKEIHPDTDFGTEFPSRFRKEGAAAPAAAAPSAPPAAKPAAAAAPEPGPAPMPAPAAELSLNLPALDDWEVPVDCFRCQGTYAVPFKHFRSGVVLYCPFCNGSYVVTTSIYGRVARALTEFDRNWREEFETFQERRRRELEAFEERQRRALENLNDGLRRFSSEARPPGAPRRRAGIFG
jgi:ferredoxin